MLSVPSLKTALPQPGTGVGSIVRLQIGKPDNGEKRLSASVAWVKRCAGIAPHPQFDTFTTGMATVAGRAAKGRVLSNAAIAVTRVWATWVLENCTIKSPTFRPRGVASEK
jgi:hypothetical protein